jgi:phosphoribosylpyrophosphate synthetase
MSQPRAVNLRHFSCDLSLPAGSHVLLIDDTWATGGHAHSAALALRKVGARTVSLLVVARWLKEDYGGNRSFIADLARRDFNPQTCPWTGNECP